MTWLNRQHGIHIGLFILLILALLIVLAPRMAQGAGEGRTAIEVGKLIAPNGDTAFGWSVALDDRTAVLGGTDVAYVFVEDATGRWVEQANLPGFSGPVALDGDTALVGNGVFVRPGAGEWILQAVLETDEVENRPVALSGDTAMIGSLVFVRNPSGAWTEQAELLNPLGPDAPAWNSVLLTGDTATTGFADCWYGSCGGQTVVFKRSPGGAWSGGSQLAVNGPPLASDGQTLIALGWREEGCDEKGKWCWGSDVLYAFERDPEGNWSEKVELPGIELTRSLFECFGPLANNPMAVDGDTISVGDPYRGDGLEAVARLYRGLNGDEWIAEDVFHASDAAEPTVDTRFGYSVSMSGGLVLVGEPRDCSEGCADDFYGEAYIFRIVPGEDTEVVMDVRPGTELNAVHTRYGLIPVALLTTSTGMGDALDFDALQIDPRATVLGRGWSALRVSSRNVRAVDVDGDGDVDLLLRFRARDAGILCGDTGIGLYGHTYGGDVVTSVDGIRTVMCGGLTRSK